VEYVFDTAKAHPVYSEGFMDRALLPIQLLPSRVDPDSGTSWKQASPQSTISTPSNLIYLISSYSALNISDCAENGQPLIVYLI
jgi:hypothetical protein